MLVVVALALGLGLVVVEFALALAALVSVVALADTCRLLGAGAGKLPPETAPRRLVTFAKGRSAAGARRV